MIRRTLALSRLVLLLAGLLTVACSSDSASEKASASSADARGDEAGAAVAGDDDSDASSSPGGDGDGEGEAAPVEPGPDGQSGVLTAGAWDDNRNYERFLAFRAAVHDSQAEGLLDFTKAEHDAASQAFGGDRDANGTLDVALVIDTTGSMGDEISYLQTEFLSLSRAIEEKYPEAAQRWSLVAYKDEGDSYVVRSFDFRADAGEFRTQLAELSANGGGDFPEAPDAALAQMATLGWRDDADTARLAFWVADAPHHAEQAKAMSDAVRAAAGLDVHVYPVASSGIDALTELSMRSTAQLTGGRYLFLTDDSGVGGEHAEPSIPCYFVTRLDQAILRMVDIELSGSYREPAAAEVLRTGGEPKDGACALEGGGTAEAF